MTKNEFAALCEEHCVTPAIALESTAVRDALRNRRSHEEVVKVLSKEF